MTVTEIQPANSVSRDDLQDKKWDHKNKEDMKELKIEPVMN
jgi:hypothetical protein